ncbi:MAG TPA: ABC transporter ATP-binding protein [Phycisphaerae bacterium]|nr:ABC transporter ATP-binding protein [Phycisphaerae bacterium]HUU59562.1 ABC transporter ATP-binding protein [Phycisphaerae bacterium]
MNDPSAKPAAVPPAVKVAGLHKSYRLGKVGLHVLRGVSFSVERGEFVSIVGASGSGKSTLLHLIGLLDTPDKGAVALDGVEIGSLWAGRRNHIRCRDVGFVFQFYHLLPELNVLENVLLPAKVDASVVEWFARRRPTRKGAMEVLERLGLQERLKHRPRELSGGERQRVAIARAMINRPKVLLADEPTGNLDSKSGARILDLLQELNRTNRQTLLMVTHDPAVAGRADRILHLRDGKLTPS